ncbi:hypothetical protein [Flavobacterium capsici]|uniref:Lipoprotein n=1 Tax=Flavobacterium capsici TaxID=3075618 RepID=A0AA96F399_9FLAO|nr:MULTISPECIES: hypothetical protein [unclassified Flavobacterium]WNM18172.1 hypothetical protein RN608_09115 [Flavobacterium sp. PMR2A8]WNM22223.1 hypothetical protein RN605_02415 [Flavobacterium sp. PMTSA4]
MKIYLSLFFIFLLGCSHKKEESTIKQFIVFSIENEVFVSAKSNFNDTLFYEHKYSDTTKYSYIKLTKEENEELKKLIENILLEKDSPKFALSSGQELFIINNKKPLFYVNNYINESENYKKINLFFLQTSSKMVSANEIKNFWNIADIVPPPHPPKKGIKLHKKS